MSSPAILSADWQQALDPKSGRLGPQFILSRALRVLHTHRGGGNRDVDQPCIILTDALRSGVITARDVLDAANAQHHETVQQSLMRLVYNAVGPKRDYAPLQNVVPLDIATAEWSIARALKDGVTNEAVLIALFDDYKSPDKAPQVLDHIACMHAASDQGAPAARARNDRRVPQL